MCHPHMVTGTVKKGVEQRNVTEIHEGLVHNEKAHHREKCMIYQETTQPKQSNKEKKTRSC